MPATMTAPSPVASTKKSQEMSPHKSCPTAALTSSLLKMSKQKQKQTNGKTSEQNILKTIKHPCIKPFLAQEPARGTMTYYTVSVGTAVNAYYNGIIRRYVHNRGSGGIRNTPDRRISSTICAVRDDFNPLILGTPVMAMVKEAGECFYVLADGHQRFDGLLSRSMIGKMTTDEVQFPITIGICHIKDHLHAYVGLGQSRPHTPSQRLLNEDLIIGFHLSKILRKCKNDIKGLKLKQFSNVAYALWALRNSKNGKLPDYWKVFSPAKLWAREMSLKSKDDRCNFKMTDEKYSKLASALDFYLSWRETLRHAISQDKSDAKKLVQTTLGSAPLCGLILIDHLRKKRSLIGQRGPSVFAQRCLKNYNWLAEFIPCITHGSAENMEITINRIFTKIGR